jgi:Fe-Mn family superoxide dismutase
MKKFMIQLSVLALTVNFISCNDKKLEEVVEIPKPEEKTELVLGNPEDVTADEGAFKMISLKYGYGDLEPYIDGRTMEIHFSKHHLGYTNNLNKAIAGTAMEKMTIEELLTNLDPENKAVRNNAGGYFNHNLFWEVIGGNNKGGVPTGELGTAINTAFGSFEAFKTQFTEAAMKQFGSGWAWLVVGKDKKVSIVATPNQDNPLMTKAGYNGHTPILGVDVWEHAYYLNYQNKRKDYVDAFFNVINWEVVDSKFNAVK